jgi:hypothetical protein
MRRTGRATVRDLLWNFARAEFELPPQGPRHTQPILSDRLREGVARGARERFTRADWAQLREAVLSTRATIVSPLFTLVRSWFLAELEPDDLAKLRVMNLRIFTSLVPSRRLPDLAAALDRGVFPEVWDPRHYRHLRAAFDLDRMYGLPIVVGERSAGPLIIVEGTTRLSVIATKQARGEWDGRPVPTLIGVGAQLGTWEWY